MTVLEGTAHRQLAPNGLKRMVANPVLYLLVTVQQSNKAKRPTELGESKAKTKKRPH